MDIAKKYIDERFEGKDREVLLKIINTAIVEGSNFDQLVSSIDKIFIGEFNRK